MRQIPFLPFYFFLFFFELSFSSLSTGSTISDNSAALCEGIQNGIILHPKNYLSILKNGYLKKVPKCGFWGFISDFSKLCGLMKSRVEVAMDKFDEDAVLINK